jgi:hypothetical protein
MAHHSIAPGILARRRLGHCLSNHQSDADYSPDTSSGFTIPTVTPSPGRRLLSRRPPPHPHDGPKVSVVPWFSSTTGHSDFSHGIACDFTSRLIRPATQLRRAGPYETSRGNAENFPTAPSAHTLLCPDAPSISFTPIVRARHHLERADRFAIIGYGSVFRLKPFRPHLTMSALSCAIGQHHTTANNHNHRVHLPTAPSEALPPPLATDPAWGRSDWTFTSKLSAPPGAHYEAIRLPTLVHLRRTTLCSLSGPARDQQPGRGWDLPVLAHEGSVHAMDL